MKRYDVMLDIETLGLTADEQIIQVASVLFDIETGDIKRMFDRYVDITIDKNIVISGNTLKWWLETDSKLLADILDKGYGCEWDVLWDWKVWLSTVTDNTEDYFKDVYVWGNGILFDNKIISEKMSALDMKYPVFYRNDRDMRTIMDLACMKTGKTIKELSQGLVIDKAHNALNDCVYQSKLVSRAYNILMRECSI